MTVRITQRMIDGLGGAYTLANIQSLRAILVAGGVEDIELHPLEIEAIRESRQKEATFRSRAERLLAAGPLPECRCLLESNGSGLVATTNGCKLGHRVGLTPDRIE